MLEELTFDCPDCELDSCEYRELCEYVRSIRAEE